MAVCPTCGALGEVGKQCDYCGTPIVANEDTTTYDERIVSTRTTPPMEFAKKISIYQYVSEFFDNVAVVSMGALHGVINLNGDIILPLEYSEILLYPSHLCWAKKNEKRFLLDLEKMVDLKVEYGFRLPPKKIERNQYANGFYSLNPNNSYALTLTYFYDKDGERAFVNFQGISIGSLVKDYGCVFRRTKDDNDYFDFRTKTSYHIPEDMGLIPDEVKNALYENSLFQKWLSDNGGSLASLKGPTKDNIDNPSNSTQNGARENNKPFVEEGIEHGKQEGVQPETNNTVPSSSIDQNKKKPLNPWYILLPFGALLIAFICVIIVRNREDYKRGEGAISSVGTNSSQESTQYVYSCAYDGFVNMRATASYSAPKVGEFRNGPEGAILLEEEGDWIRIDVNGLVGFVPSKYVRKTPTVAYTGDITIDWFEGVWVFNGSFITLIYNNGTYESCYDSHTLEVGKYIMQNKDEIVFTPLWIEEGLLDGSDDAERYKEYTLKITNRTEKEMSRLFQDGSVMSYRQIRILKEMEECGDEDMLTINNFRSRGRDVLKLIEEIEK